MLVHLQRFTVFIYFQLLSDKIRVLDLRDCDISDNALLEIAKVCRYLQNIDLNALKDSRTNITSQGTLEFVLFCSNVFSIWSYENML